jgi:mannosyltransferase
MRLTDRIHVGRDQAILASILAFALLFRLFCLGCESFWTDEAFTVERISSGPVALFAGEVQHPPLYFLLLYAWSFLLGQSELALRLLSVAFGLASVFLAYRVCGLIAERRTGLIAAALMSLSTFQLYFSQEARPYAMFSAMALLSMYFFLRLPEGKGRHYMLSTALMLYTHVFGVFIVLSQNAYVLYLRWRGRALMGLRGWLRHQYVLALAFLPWIVVVAVAIAVNQGGVGWIPVPTPLSILETLSSYSGYYYLYPSGVGTQLYYQLNEVSYVLSALVIGLAALAFLPGPVGGKRKTRGRKARGMPAGDAKALLLLWLGIPIILPFIMSLVFFPIYWTRYTMAASPAFYMLAAIGMRRIRPRHAALLVMSAVVALSLFNGYRYFAETNKEQWREAAAYIDANGGPGDGILMYKDFSEVALKLYLQDPLPIHKVLSSADGSVTAEELRDAAAFAAQHDRVWLVLSHHLFTPDDNPERIRAALSATHNVTGTVEFTGIEIYLLEKP